MIITTYDFDPETELWENFGFPLRKFDHDDGRREQELTPGDTVYHADNGGSGYGTLVALSHGQATVLWSEEPTLVNSRTFKGRRRGTALDIIVVQAMPQPKHLYYFDPDRVEGPVT